MKLDQNMIEWIEQHLEIITDVMSASQLVKNGKIELFFQDGKYIGTDAVTRKRLNKQFLHE